MRAWVHGCVRTYAYAFMGVDVPHVDVKCVRACVRAQIEGMVVFYYYIFNGLLWSGGSGGKGEGDVRGLAR